MVPNWSWGCTSKMLVLSPNPPSKFSIFKEISSSEGLQATKPKRRRLQSAIEAHLERKVIVDVAYLSEVGRIVKLSPCIPTPGDEDQARFESSSLPRRRYRPPDERY